MSGQILPIAQIAPSTEAEGPGRRFAIWLQGCPLRCRGCCNPQMLPFSGGTPTTVDDLFGQIETTRERDGIEGISLLGGEPFAHAGGAGELAERVQAAGLSVMVYSGYTLAQIEAIPGEEACRLLRHTDVLVDGPFERDVPDRKRRWVGSTNQVVHILTDRYRADDPCWRAPNTLEIRLKDGELLVNGFPGEGAVDLWAIDRSLDWRRRNSA